MVEHRLKIDRLVVRMRGVTEPQARELVAGLGEAVLRRLNDASAVDLQPPGVRHIERIDAGTVALTSRDRLADHLADCVMANIPPAKGDQ